MQKPSFGRLGRVGLIGAFSTVFLVICGIVAVGSAHAQEPLPPGASFPSIDASLQRVNGDNVTVQNLLGSSGTVILFWSNQCPWVDKYESRVQDLVSEFGTADVKFVLVNANDASVSADESLEASRRRAEQRGYEAAYVRDDGATLARALGATRTPHAFVFDGSRTLVYEGAIDDSPGDPNQVEEAYLRRAVLGIVNGEDVSVPETKAFGCTLKYPN